MIFLTIGTQLPFDRLVQVVDDISADIDEPVLAQIGNSEYSPRNFKAQASFSPREFDEAVRGCRVLLSHAGIGSILTAKRLSKPIIIFPRLASLGEHRNDHQIATCDQLEGRQGIYVARTADTLRQIISGIALEGTQENLEASETEIAKKLRQHLKSVVARK